MKSKKFIENLVITVFFIVVMVYPIAFYFFGEKVELSGAEEKVTLNFSTLDDYILQNFPGRANLIKIKNQFLYKFFDISPNSSIAKVGDNLFSTEVLNNYYHGLYHMDEKAIDDTVDKFDKLNNILKKKGKKLVILTTPTKARYYDGKLPFADDVISAYGEKMQKRTFDIFREKLKSKDFYYFDFVECIDNNKEKFLLGEVPLFYKSGHHWSNYKANLLGVEMVKYLIDKVGLALSRYHIDVKKTDTPMHPDSDLFTVLNVYDKPNEQFYETSIVYDDIKGEEKNFIIQGGSFLGALTCNNFTIGNINTVIHIENKMCMYNHYNDRIDFESYDELNEKVNLLDAMKKNDVYILEVHEVNVYNATFGFIDYLLEHEDML